MNRRGYLAGGMLGLVGATAFAGCQAPRADGGGDPAVDGSAVTLAPGETVSVTVTARNVDRLSFGVPFLDSEALTVESFDVSPAADATLESYPPVWTWENARSSVEATMTVRADDDAAPTTTSYGVTAARGDTTVTEEFEITVGTPSG